MVLQEVASALYVNPRQIHRLSTHEDAHFFHLHKIFGVLALVNFGYRLHSWLRYGHLGFDASFWTLGWICAHAMLHVSSFEFIIPNRRNKVYNVIWPEMRWHSLLFAYRSLLVMLIMWLYESGTTGDWIQYARGAVVILTMVGADYATKYYKSTDTTMRGNPYPAWVPPAVVKGINTFYSMAQVSATMNMLFRGKSLAFMALIPIQTAPFGMTLVKKGIVNQGGWHITYIIALLINYFYAMGDGIEVTSLKVLTVAFAIARFRFHVNKYILWGVIIAYQWYLLCCHKGWYMDMVMVNTSKSPFSGWLTK